jgi:hypothetical protein
VNRSRIVLVYLLFLLLPARLNAQSAGKVIAVNGVVTLQHGTQKPHRLTARDEFAAGDLLLVPRSGAARIALYANGARYLLAPNSS